MPSISQKGNKMPESPIRKLVPFADEAKLRGTKIFHLNIGQPDIKTPDLMMDAIRNVDFEVLAYSHSAGIESYRKKLLGYYSKHGISLTINDLLVTTGGSEALLFAFMSTLDPEDELIVPEPFYANYNGFSVSSGIKIKPITAKIDSDFALPNIAQFEEVISSKTKGILICNPSNPTGYLYSKEELEVLRKICIKHDLYLFADEVYREFAYGDVIHHSILSLDGLEDNAIVVDSISKRFSACGARIGCLVTRNKEVQKTVLKFAQARLSPPTFGQIGAEAALDLPDSYYEEVLSEYEARRNVLISGLNNIPGVNCPLPGGAFYAMAELPVDDTEVFCKWMLQEFSYEGATVMMAPGAGFYSSPGLGQRQVRIAYVLEIESLKKALKCLEKGIRAYNAR